MYLRIDENDFGDDYYDRFLTVNGVRKQFAEKVYELSFEEEFEEQELEVVIESCYIRITLAWISHLHFTIRGQM